MNIGQLRSFIEIVKLVTEKDSEGFADTKYETIAKVRAYHEARHGSQKLVDLAAFSESTDLFKFRKIPGLTVTTSHIIICDSVRYDITSVDDISGRGMYVEVLAKRSEMTNGKG